MERMDNETAASLLFFPAWEGEGDLVLSEEGALTRKEMLQVRLPAVVYDTRWSSPLPPRDYSCEHPPLFISRWDGLCGEVNDFMDNLPDDDDADRQYSLPQWQRAPAKRRFDIALDVLLAIGMLTPDEIVSWGSRSVRGSPDMAVEVHMAHGGCLPLMVGVVERPEKLPALAVGQIVSGLSDAGSPFWAVVGRMHEYMFLSNVNYGVITTREYSWFCFKIRGSQTLVMSDPVMRENTSLGFYWYILHLALTGGEPSAGLGQPYVVGRPLADTGAFHEFVKDMVKASVRGMMGMSSRNLHQKLKFWKYSDFEFGSCISKRVCDVFRGKYKGKDALLKVRDLSEGRNSFSKNMEMFVTEILIYKKLKRVQGDAVPKLIDFGFTNGYLFAVLVLSYGGVPLPPHPEDAGRARLLSGLALNALQKIHRSGIYHGQIDSNDVLLRDDTRMTIVGFSRAGVAGDLAMSSKAWSREIVRVKAICGDCVDDENESSSTNSGSSSGIGE